MSDKKSVENPLIDLGDTTVSAFNLIRNAMNDKEGKTPLTSIAKNVESNINKSTYVYVYTPQDKKRHQYFHSLSTDKQVEDFMGTAELRCPFDSDLMEYWEPIRNYCIIYGSNQGESNAKILFIGRVRGVKQEGYELVIQFQDPYWKFKQLVTQSYANDNVLNKDGYTIMKLIFEALKFDSWVITPTAKHRLQQVGIDKDGNVTLNKKKVEEMPDLLKRLKKSNPSKEINKSTIYNKAKESKEGNVKNINYTLKYEKPTPVMQKIASQGASGGGYSPGQSVYGTNYGAASASSSGRGQSGGSASSTVSASGTPRPPANLCSNIGNSQVISAMKVIWSYNRGYTNNYSIAEKTVLNFARNSPATYSSRVAPCLSTLSKYCIRKDKRNIAYSIKQSADVAARSSGVNKTIINTAASMTANAINRGQKAYNQIKRGNILGALGTLVWG